LSITTRDRETVAKILALVGSDHDGEAIAAARKADAYIKARGATWQDLLLEKPTRIVPQPTPSRRTTQHEHVRLATDLLRRGRNIINPWERNFLLSILAYRELKPRQLETLSLISRKISLAKAHVACRLPISRALVLM
jgi:hypothetical protein